MTAAADLDKLKSRIQALRAKTVQNGCTEAEALSAAAKVAELLDQYDLSLSDVDLRQSPCEQGVIDTNRKQRQPITSCIPAIAAYCDCKVWMEKTPEGKVRYIFFGMKAGVEIAHYIHDVIAIAMQSEWDAYRKAQRFIRYSDDARGSFLLGMALSVADKLTQMKTERDAATRQASGRDLVVVRHAVVDAEFAKLDLKLKASRASSRKVTAGAFEAGQDAGRALALHDAVNGDRSQGRRLKGR